MSIHTPKKKRVPIDGVLLLDKPAGITSNDALVRSKRLFNALKAGHTGTLDPFATGLLPLCFGEATKFTQDLLDADKTYETVVHLGVKTSTGDTEGTEIQNLPVEVTRQQIELALAGFRGVISQIPPMHSALKRNGKALYEYAREGIVLEREARQVTIHALDIIDYQAPYLSLRVKCSKGTYIRVLGEDIGTALRCGAHLKELRRIAVAELSLSSSITLEKLTELPEEDRKVALLGVDSLLSSFPAIFLPDFLAQRFLQGQRLPLGKEGIAFDEKARKVRVYRDSDRQLLGTAQIREFDILAPERLIATAHL